MSTSRHLDRICAAITALTLVLTILFMCGGSLGLKAAAKTVKYESTLFDPSYVHKIDLVMNDWDSFLETCENEEYAACTVVVDGNKHSNIAIRAKGNTSLSSVRDLGSQRYSFKLEFDRYEAGKSLDGLDKLCLNNLIQDNTMMKDYLVYRMMGDFGADSPLCSFVYLTVNGEDWGLYLAVEGVEDSFLARNYGSDPGELYKPDSMSFGGGRGNGKDFNMDAFDLGGGDGTEESAGSDESQPAGFPFGSQAPEGGQFPPQPEGDGEVPNPPEGGQFPPQPGGDGEVPNPPEGGQFPPQPGGDGEVPNPPEGGQFPPQLGGDGQIPSPPEGGQFPTQPGSDGQFPTQPGGNGQPGGFGPGGRGSDDVKLKYIDDDPDSYANIFDNAKTDTSAEDRKRLIRSLKQLSAYADLEDVLDTDEVLRYFVVHNFVCNGDSYTGSMIHNYYLHEKDGRLGMIPWDYNLAFGTFQGGDAARAVNASIDSPVSGGAVDDRPMVGWIFSNEACTEAYHTLFAAFLERWFANGELEALIGETAELLRPYVERDPTKFCTAEEFEKGVTALSAFVSLRAEAVRRQLAGDSTAVETAGLTLSDLGAMGGGRPGGRAENRDGTVPSGQTGAGAGPGTDGASIPAQTGTDGDAAAEGQGSQNPAPSDPGGEDAAAGKSQRPGRPGAAGSTQFPGGARPDGEGQETGAQSRFWLLIGASVLVLAVGLIVAVRKKI